MANRIPIELRDGNKPLFFYETKRIGKLCELLFEFYVKKDKPHNKRNISSIKRQAQGFNPKYVDSKQSKQIMTLKRFEPEMEYIFTLNPDETRELIKKINTLSREFKRVKSTKEYKSQLNKKKKIDQNLKSEFKKSFNKLKEINKKIKEINKKKEKTKSKLEKMEKQISIWDKMARKKHSDYKEYRKKHGIIKARKKFKPTFRYGFNSKSHAVKRHDKLRNKLKAERQLHTLKNTLKYLEKDLVFAEKRFSDIQSRRNSFLIISSYDNTDVERRIKLIKPVLIDQVKKNRNTKITFGPWL